MERANADIRMKAINAGVHLWQIASALGIRDNEFSRKLRFELPSADKSRIFEIINDLSTKRGGDLK